MMEELIPFVLGALCVVAGNLLATWRERSRVADQMFFIRQLLNHNRTLQNRLSAKDISGYLAQEKFDYTVSQNGSDSRETVGSGYPQNIVGSG